MNKTIGAIVWTDLTVEDAGSIKDFYSAVVGWESSPHDMGSYNDYEVRSPQNNQTVAGICHARDSNANVPPQWLVYVNVASVEESAQRCRDLGGKIIDGPRKMGVQNFCVIQDPAGAVLALIEPI